MGVGSGLDRMDAYRRLSLSDLPKQRRYYQKAFDVAKAVMSSSLGQQLRDGPRELVVDYVLNMESLFEQYSQVVIERELSYIKSYDHLGDLDDVTPVRSPSVNPFEGEGQIYEPDHALQEGDETLAVLDSKYYAEGHDPVKESPSRSRLFSYAYLLHADRLAFLCPLLEPKRRQVTQTGAELQIVSPEQEFTLDGYGDVIQTYLHDVLVTRSPELEAFRAVAEKPTVPRRYRGNGSERREVDERSVHVQGCSGLLATRSQGCRRRALVGGPQPVRLRARRRLDARTDRDAL